MRMRNNPRRKTPEKVRPIKDNEKEAVSALASVSPSELKPEHLPVEEQAELYERQGKKLAAKMSRDRATEQARRKSPTEQVPLNLETSKKPEQRPQQETLNLRTEVVARDKAEQRLIARLVNMTLAKMRPSGHRTRWIDERTAASVVVNADNPLRPSLEKERLIGLVATEAQSRRAAKPDVR